MPTGSVHYLLRGDEGLPIIADSFISSCSSINNCLTYFDVLLLGTYTLSIISSWRMIPFLLLYTAAHYLG
jgi:hypothetical protein